MKVNPAEIKEISDIGTLNGKPVKLLKFKGGYQMAMGFDQGKEIESILAAGSHGAIVKFNLEKQYMGYRPNLMKSEGEASPIVNKHSTYLSDDLLKSGHDIYSIQNGTKVEFQLTKHDVKIGNMKAELENGGLSIKESNVSKQFANAFAGAVAEKSLMCGTSKVSLKG